MSRALDETLFAPESRDAPIQIAGPAESAGLTADAVWFLGADEDAWPASGATHPLLPIEVQREAGMPHATPQLDWELAAADHPPPAGLRARGPLQLCKAERGRRSPPLAADRAACRRAAEAAAGVDCASRSRRRSPFPLRTSAAFPSLRARSRAAPAFSPRSRSAPSRPSPPRASPRRSWEPAEAGLTASQRGSLLHAVLHAVWAGPPEGIRSHAELLSLNDREAFVAGHVQRVFARELRPHLRELMPRRYLELEEQRLTELVTEWLEYEATRIAFEVAETEVKRTVHIAGLTLDLRLDRIDRLNDGSLLVIDYKSGNVSPSSGTCPAPTTCNCRSMPALPSTADEELGGLVFAKVRAGESGFAGQVGDAAATLFTGLKGTSSLVKNPLTAEQLLDWRDCIEQLARDFLAGRAEVDPRESPKTCERCGLQTLCRIQEHRGAARSRRRIRRARRPAMSKTPANPRLPISLSASAPSTPRRSILVQAPAGSGKTDLLTRRFLRLLAEVEEPGQIVAITFTNAAAAEMRHRILDELEKAADRSRFRSGRVLDGRARPSRAGALRRRWAGSCSICPRSFASRTIDSFCRELALQQPLLSGLGGGLEIAEQPDELYRRAARETLRKIDQTGSALGAAIEELLLWRDNGWQEMEDLLVEMLRSRDRWMHGFVLEREPDWEALRERLERPFANAVRDALDRVEPASRSGSRRARRSAGAGAVCLRAKRRPASSGTRRAGRVSLRSVHR